MLLKNVREKTPTLLTAVLFLLIPLDYVLPHFGNATVVTMISIIMIFYGAFYISRRRKIHISQNMVSLVFLLIVFCISYFWAINKNVVLSRFVSVTNTVLLYCTVVQFRFEKEAIEFVENASILGAMILVVWVYKNIDLDLVYAGYRLRFSQLGSEYFSDPNGLAGRIIFPFVIILNRAFYNQGKRKGLLLLYGTLIIVFTYILLLTGSRAGLIAIAIAAILFSKQSFENKKSWVTIGIIVIIVLFYLLAPHFLPQHIIERLFSVGKYKEVTELEGDRIDIWKHIINELFFSSPLFGYGGGCSAYALSQFYGHLKAVHNSYLIVLCETGLLGFIPWMYFIIKQIRDAVLFHKNSTALLSATIAVLFIAMTLDAFTEKYFWSIFFYIYIIKYCFVEESKEKP